jgi:5'(3')-deoxyribonucleotidase
MKVAVDWDDVIVDTLPVVLDALNQRQPDDLHTWTVEDITEWDLTKITGFSHKIIMQEFDELNYRNTSQVSGAVYFMNSWIHEGLEVVVLTANPNVHKIRKHMDRIGLENFLLIHEPNKGKWCYENGVELLIDDNPQTIADCAQYSVKCIRFLRPWNEKFRYIGNRVKTSSTWHHVNTLVKGWALDFKS